jgi:CDP-diglyceride synthetase
MLRQRLVAALLGLPTLFVLLWLNWLLRYYYGNQDDLFLLLTVGIIAGASGREVSHIIQQRYPETSPWNGVFAALIIPFIVHAVRPALGGVTTHVGSFALLIDSIGATAMVMLLFLGVWGDIEHRGRTGIIENLYVVGAGLYLGLTTSFVLLLGMTPFHEAAAALVFVAVFALDTSAYFGGKVFGGVRMAPEISPNKTWAGAVVGFLGAVALSLLFLVLPAIPGSPALGKALPPLAFLVIGAAVGVFGQVGDLLESAVKRWGGVKDSGHALLGHGGFLDRFDSLFLAAPACYLLLVLFMKG